MDLDTFSASRPTLAEPSSSDPPEFTLWQWKPRPSDFDPPDNLYKELFTEWPAPDGRAIRCRLCGKVSKQDRGIGNFKVHLGWCHPNFLVGKDRREPSYGGARVKSERKRTSSAASTNSILQYAQPAGIAKADLARWLAEFCAEGCFPLRIVESPALQKLLRRAISNSRLPFELPSRYLVGKALDGLVAECSTATSARIAKTLAPSGGFHGMIAVTADTWTSRALHGYLCTTIAYIDNDWQLRSEVAACVPLPGSHTGLAIVEGITKAIQGPATMDHVAAIVSDGGSNFVSATNLLCSERSLRCAAHTIQLALKDVAKTEPMASILSAVMRVLVRLSKSPMRREALARAAEEAGARPLMPIYPVATRWDSNYYALNRFYQMRDALDRLRPHELGFSSLAEHKAVWQPAADAIRLLLPLCRVLGVFAKWTRELQSANRVTLSRIPAAFNEMLKATTQNAEDCEIIATIKEQLHTAVSRRLDGLASSPLVRLAQFLDPTQHRDRYRRDESGQFSVETMDDLTETVSSLVNFVADSLRRVRDDSPPVEDKLIPSLMQQLFAPHYGWASIPLSNATAKYIQCDKTDAADPLQWWRERGKDLAPLDAIARWFLCIPATSAESERTFSLAGWLVSSTRTRLSGKRVNDLVLLRRHLSCKDEGDSSSERTIAAETSGSEESDEGDRMAELVDEGILDVSPDGILVPACDHKLLDAQPTDGASDQEDTP